MRIKPTCSHSTQRLKRREPVNLAAALRWSPMKFVLWHSVLNSPRRKFVT
ncbi:Uncharacterised protein [Vibrio cholerae]|nr:Uncharacterised protein [Vibrio cholerae]